MSGELPESEKDMPIWDWYLSKFGADLIKRNDPKYPYPIPSLEEIQQLKDNYQPAFLSVDLCILRDLQKNSLIVLVGQADNSSRADMLRQFDDSYVPIVWNYKEFPLNGNNKVGQEIDAWLEERGIADKLSTNLIKG